MKTTKKCCNCDKSLPLEDFYPSSKAKDGRQSKCKPCHREYRKSHYESNKSKYISKAADCRQRYRQEFLDFIKTKSCVDCGNDDWRVLEFDHQRDKSFNICEKKGQRTLKSLMSEIEKCEIVCANCHRIRSHEQFSYYEKCLDEAP